MGYSPFPFSYHGLSGYPAGFLGRFQIHWIQLWRPSAWCPPRFHVKVTNPKETSISIKSPGFASILVSFPSTSRHNVIRGDGLDQKSCRRFGIVAANRSWSPVSPHFSYVDPLFSESPVFARDHNILDHDPLGTDRHSRDCKSRLDHSRGSGARSFWWDERPGTLHTVVSWSCQIYLVIHILSSIITGGKTNLHVA